MTAEAIKPVPGPSLSSVQAIISIALVVGLGTVMPGRVSAQTFLDVPTDHPAFSFIESLVTSGVAAGCSGGNYCPDDAVSRAEIAIFLERGLRGSDFSPQPATGNSFLDVGTGDFGAGFIEQLFRDAKGQIGYNHFEVRKYVPIQRHIVMSMVSQLFLMQETARVWEKKPMVECKASKRSRRGAA